MKRRIFFWLLAIVLTLAASVYQRRTGPTVPATATLKMEKGDCVFKFPRSVSTEDLYLEIRSSSDFNLANGFLHWRSYNSHEIFRSIPLWEETGNWLFADLPPRHALDKIEYYVTINDTTLFKDEPLVVRYKDPVPSLWLMIHIVLMFLSMLFAAYGFIVCFTKNGKVYRYLTLTLWTLFLGGIVFGAIIQKYAFGVFWTGFPFGNDVTDNKTLLALIILLLAVLFRNKSYFRYISMFVFAVMFAVYCIPHSV
ncbi:MAG: hypothetical protein LBR28_00330 [Bacteroidales bacterium]|jgi:hypothetical protein|nr:hypothetical protein [Bacteroidales bacterium]